jgi:hypothetical protein
MLLKKLFIFKKSVKLCLQLLDASVHRDHKISVEKAKFEMKGASYDPARAAAQQPKKKKLNKTKEKKIIDQQRQKCALNETKI